MHLEDIFVWVLRLPNKIGLLRNDSPWRAPEPKSSDDELEQLVRRDLAFLFTECGAKLSANNYFPRSFGNAIIEIEVQNLRFRIVKDTRDHAIRVDVAPAHIPDEWETLDVALMFATGANKRASYVARYDDNPTALCPVGLTEVAQLLQPGFVRLDDAYSPARYEEMRTALMNYWGEPWLTSSKLRPGRDYPRLVRQKEG